MKGMTSFLKLVNSRDPNQLLYTIYFKPESRLSKIQFQLHNILLVVPRKANLLHAVRIILGRLKAIFK